MGISFLSNNELLEGAFFIERTPGVVVSGIEASVSRSLEQLKPISPETLVRAKEAFEEGRYFEVLNLLQIGDDLVKRSTEGLSPVEVEEFHRLMGLSCYRIVSSAKVIQDPTRLARAAKTHLKFLTIPNAETEVAVIYCDGVLRDNSNLH